MNGLHVGCAGYDGRLDLYFRALDTRELGEHEERVSVKTLGRWRSAAPESARFIPRVSASVVASGFLGEEANAGWVHTLATVERLVADTVLLRTRAGFRPTEANREALHSFFTGDRVPEGLTVAWWVEGLWDHEEHLSLCEELGIVPALDPLVLDDDETLPPGPLCYWRVLGRRGLGGALSAHELDQLCSHCEGRVGHVVFGAPQMMRDARRFAAMVGAEPAAP